MTIVQKCLKKYKNHKLTQEQKWQLILKIRKSNEQTDIDTFVYSVTPLILYFINKYYPYNTLEKVDKLYVDTVERVLQRIDKVTCAEHVVGWIKYCVFGVIALYKEHTMYAKHEQYYDFRSFELPDNRPELKLEIDIDGARDLISQILALSLIYSKPNAKYTNVDLIDDFLILADKPDNANVHYNNIIISLAKKYGVAYHSVHERLQRLKTCARTTPDMLQTYRDLIA